MITASFIRKLSARDALGEEEIRVIEGLVRTTRQVGRRETIVRAGDRLKCSLILLEGVTSRFKDTREGKRQLLELNIEGDFIDLHAFLLNPVDHGVIALTDARLGEVPHSALRQVTETMPHLTRMLWLETAGDAAVHREWMLTMGQRPAIARIAHLLCEFDLRLQAIGKSDGKRFCLPMTQAEIGEFVGISGVHVNRSVRDLRENGLASIDRGEATILDREGLRRLAEFDPAYLNLKPAPR